MRACSEGLAHWSSAPYVEETQTVEGGADLHLVGQLPALVRSLRPKSEYASRPFSNRLCTRYPALLAQTNLETALTASCVSIHRLLNWTLVLRTGVISNSIYRLRQLLCSQPGTFGFGRVWCMSFLGWLIPLLAVGFVSYHGFERPLLKARAFLRRV